jgi:hypothetical protein
MTEATTDSEIKTNSPGAEFLLLFRLVNYYFLLIPFLFVILISALILNDLFPFTKDDLENLALLICFIFSTACVIKFIIFRQSFYLWCFGLTLTFFAREVHFAGTSAAVYFSLLLHLFLALNFREKFRPYLRQPVFLNVLAIGFTCYFISQTTDQRWWRGFPYEAVVHVPLEESMEIVGHLIVCSTLLFWRPLPGMVKG